MPVRTHAETAVTIPRTSGRINRRVAVRYSGGGHTADGIHPEHGVLFRRVHVYDISQGGIALILPQSLDVGADLLIQINNRLLGFSYDLGAQVRHNTRYTKGRWIVGFEFPRELTLPELASLI